MREKIWDFMGYVTLVGLILGQIFISSNFVVGELFYVITDVIMIARDFAMKRPNSDKIKNISLTSLAFGTLIFNL